MTDVVRAGKARYIGFSGWAPEQIRTAMALPGVEGFISSQPQYSLLHRGPEAEVIPLFGRQRRLANRLVASGAGRVVREVHPGREATGAEPRRQSNHGPDDAILPAATDFGRGPTLEAPGGGGRLHDDAVCAGMGASPTQCRFGDRGGESAGSTRRQRRRLRPSYRPGPLRQGRGDRRSDPHGALELDRRRRRLVFASG